MEKELTYEDLFKNYKGENPHKEFDWGEDVGKERFWEDDIEVSNSESLKK